MNRLLCVCALMLWTITASKSLAADWSRFRGPNGSSVGEAKGIPDKWGDTENLRWKVDLPGLGSSSPLVIGDKVILTCYSGYGVDRDNPGDPKALKRHLLCYDLKTGKQVWESTAANVHEEDPYDGFLRDHGYATSTPCSDGERIYAYFGKDGLYCYDMNGKELWKKELGTGSGMNGWGSGTSPILVDGMVIVNAAAEAKAVFAIDAKTGKQVWKSPADNLEGSWSTPVVIDGANGGKELVVSAPYELWAFNPKTGAFLWFVEGIQDNVICGSPIAEKDIVYAIGGRDGAAVAVRSGGKDDAKDHIVWKGEYSAYVPSPLLHQGKIYSVSERGVLTCLSASDGKKIYAERIQGARNIYASPAVADGKIIVVTRKDGAFVVKAGDTFEQLSANKFSDDDTDFNATPAFSSDSVLLRSNKRLYCIGG